MSTGVFLLNIGDEILDGRIINSNAIFIGEKLRAAGVPVAEVRCVSDRVEDIVRALKDASRYPLVIITGGLGPTNDDRTMEAASKAFKRELISTKASLEHVRSRYNARKMELTPHRMRLALVPENSKIVQNPTGTAPGVHFKFGKAEFYFLPGVPNECRPMFEGVVLARAQKLLANKKLVRREFWRCFGLGESNVYQLVEPVVRALEKKYPETFTFGVHISFPYIDLTFEVWRVTKKQSATSTEIENAIRFINEKTHEICFTHTRENLVDVVLQLLIENKKTLSTAESCTGGMLGKLLTDIPGSSAAYFGGAISYANSAKEILLGVKKDVLIKFGAVSEPVVRQMAEGIRTKLKTDYSLALSGVSGPGGGTEEKPVGTIHVALSSDDRTETIQQLIFAGRGSRDQNRIIAANLALDALRSKLLKK